MEKKKAIKVIKIFIMASLCAAFVLNSIPSEVMGFTMHIVIGSLFISLMVGHIALSYKYFFACAKNFFKIKAKAKVNFIIDIILILLCLAVLTTGILLAKNILPAGMEYHDFETIHGLCSAAVFFIIIIHGCLHLKGKKRKPRGR